MHNRLDWQKQLVRAAMCAITVLALAQEALPAEEGPVLSGTALWALAAGAAWALYGALLRLRRPFAPARLGVLAALLAGVVVLGQSFAAVGTAEMATSRLSWTALVLVGYALLIFSAMRLLLEALSASGEKGDGRFPLPGPAPVWLGALLLAWTLCRRERRACRAWRMPALAAGCVLGVYGALHLLVLPGLNIAPTPESENYSLPLQQVARVAVGGGLTQEQEQAVSGVLPVEELKAAYNGELSDPVKALWREDATAEQKGAFWRAWPGIVLDHPMTCLSATFHNTYGYLYPGYMSVIKPTLLIGDQSTRTASVKGLYDYTVNPLSEGLEALTDRLAQNPLYRLAVSPGLYGWIALMSAVWLLRGNRGRLLGAVPALFTLGGCLLSAVNGYFRYAMPLYLCAPLLLWLTTDGGMRRHR